MRTVIYIMIAGGLGAAARYFVGGLAQRLLGQGFPYGTLTVNVLGSLLIGFIMHLSLNTDIVPPGLRTAATLGFLGAFTTFSTFSYETLGFLEDGAWLMGGLNILVNVVPCILAAFLGIVLGRVLIGGA